MYFYSRFIIWQGNVKKITVFNVANNNFTVLEHSELYYAQNNNSRKIIEVTCEEPGPWWVYWYEAENDSRSKSGVVSESQVQQTLSNTMVYFSKSQGFS